MTVARTWSGFGMSCSLCVLRFLVYGFFRGALNSCRSMRPSSDVSAFRSQIQWVSVSALTLGQSGRGMWFEVC